MFREMRRNRQQLTDEESRAILAKTTSGVLSLAGDDGYPYGVPLSYALQDDMLVFHSALTGHKIDALTANPKASFTVIERDAVVPDEFTTYYRSVIAFGRVRIVEDRDEKARLLRVLGERYWPGHPVETDEEIAPRLDHMHVLAFEIEHLSGKQAKELMRYNGSVM